MIVRARLKTEPYARCGKCERFASARVILLPDARQHWLCTRCKARGYPYNPVKARAHYLVQRALESGQLEKPLHCQCCCSRRLLVGHHPDYAEPLRLIWLCVPCHADFHKVPLTLSGGIDHEKETIAA